MQKKKKKKEHRVSNCYTLGEDLVTIATCFKLLFPSSKSVGPVSPPTVPTEGERQPFRRGGRLAAKGTQRKADLLYRFRHHMGL